MKVSVSITKSIYPPKKTIEMINQSSADYLHIDLMDAKFVQQKQQLPSELNKIIKYIEKPLDVHLMADKPLKYLEYFAKLNTEYFTFHYEAVPNIEAAVHAIKEVGLKAGLAINPQTKLTTIIPYLELFDQILIMRVKPGLGGQELIPNALDKLTELKNIKAEKELNFIISVDGGINESTIEQVKEAGNEMVVAGSYICMNEDFDSRISYIKNI